MRPEGSPSPRLGTGATAGLSVVCAASASCERGRRRAGGVQKKTLPEAVATIQATHPTATVAVWGHAAQRIGLKPILRRVWRKRGQRLVVTVQHRSTWIYLYGFVCPETGENFWLLLPTVTIAVWNSALAECATAVGAGPTKRVILVIDQAGWHTSAKATIPDGLHLVWLPSYAPELQPAERLWTLSDEAVANEHFHDVDALVAAQAERCPWVLIARETEYTFEMRYKQGARSCYE